VYYQTIARGGRSSIGEIKVLPDMRRKWWRQEKKEEGKIDGSDIKRK